MKTAQQVLDYLVAYMRRFSYPVTDWYAGIAADPRSRLFEEHNVDAEEGHWAFDSCAIHSDARAVEKALLDFGCQGGSGGGDDNTKSCYVYVITNTTRE